MNISLPKGTWVDLYAETGIPVGTRIEAVNLTPNDVQLASTQNEPVPGDDLMPLLFGKYFATNQAGDLGAWAKCPSQGGIDVRVV